MHEGWFGGSLGWAKCQHPWICMIVGKRCGWAWLCCSGDWNMQQLWLDLAKCVCVGGRGVWGSPRLGCRTHWYPWGLGLCRLAGLQHLSIYMRYGCIDSEEAAASSSMFIDWCRWLTEPDPALAGAYRSQVWLLLRQISHSIIGDPHGHTFLSTGWTILKIIIKS